MFSRYLPEPLHYTETDFSNNFLLINYNKIAHISYIYHTHYFLLFLEDYNSHFCLRGPITEMLYVLFLVIYI